MNPKIPTTRREFLSTSAKSGIGLLAFGQFAPAFLTQSVMAGQPTAEQDRSILVLIQLGGGNDGLNTLIPYQDDNYYRLRPSLGIKPNVAIPIHDHLALHPSCSAMERLFKDGQMAIVQNVGYPNPNRSHFRSMEIWETASKSSDYLSTGWLGRYFDNACSGLPEDEPVGLNVGDELPDAFLNESGSNVFSLTRAANKSSKFAKRLAESIKTDPDHHENGNASFLRHTLMNALVSEESVLARIRDYKSGVEYPSTNLARDLRNVAALIASDQPTRAYYVSHSGFDTHASQIPQHAKLLEELSDAVAAFQADLAKSGLQDQVVTMTFSEFGRRPSENKSGGTDHGTAAPLFVFGNSIKGGIYGNAPKLDLDRNQDLTFSTDFRQVYASLIDNWMDGDSSQILGQQFKPLNFV